MDHFNMDVIIDFQAFKDNNNEFVIKECAVVAVDNSFVEHWVVAPPYEFHVLKKDKRREAVWIKQNHHGLSWSDGGISYKSFQDELRLVCCDVSRVFVKGKEKTEFIKGLLKNAVIINLEDYNTPRLKRLMLNSYLPVLRCFRHCKHKNYICALSNADKLKMWVITNNHVFN
jgi:hypothetical protein